MELNENELAWWEMSVTSLILQRAWQMELGQIGLTVPQTLVLIAVADSPEPITPMKLSRILHREPHTISALLTRMEAQGLVKKERNLERGNWVRVTLTKKGKEAYQRQLKAKKVRNVTECLSRQELEELNKMNRKLRARGVQLLREMLPSPYGDPLW
ncbi:MAG: MarR family winged helix-turn-helix transcriptional regulator [Dehalococcoidia bacterium]|nr:MarR family winged helix-turn-helix transcriptional regulator [Dehalococcoidia bacterium]